MISIAGFNANTQSADKVILSAWINTVNVVMSDTGSEDPRDEPCEG
jgi:hypothetical protein